MITEDEISGIIDSMNNGGVIPSGVEPVSIDRKKNVYTRVNFDGLGMYYVDPNTNPTKIMTEEQVQEIKDSL